jgi:hypothetical protein
VTALRGTAQTGRHVVSGRQRTLTVRRAGGAKTKSITYLDKGAALKSGGRSRSFLLPAAQGEPVSLSANDRAELLTIHRTGEDEFSPAGALYGLYHIGRDSYGAPRDYDSFYVISGISRIESPTEQRTATLVSALEALTRLDEPLAQRVRRGGIHDATWSLTDKGRRVAEALLHTTHGEDYRKRLDLGYQGHIILREILTPND